eukprot:TRINITY_DN7805_c0_g1_i1.p1 TRINITY_DN7805_c0_g1~~TRINITY_DN7805_c0_g1_i1.p1  ORF type:complete len:181 (+),score=36.12 TRINITY_DN7805_c0_g1_i1:67-609(+)
MSDTPSTFSSEANGVFVVGVDGSTQSEKAFRMATEMARPSDRLHVVHVQTAFDRTMWLFDTQFPNISTESENTRAAHWAQHVRRKFESLCAEAKRDCSFTVLSRSPSTAAIGDAICTEAQRVGAKAVVVGSHGYTATERFILGSVANFMVNHCDCNLVISREARAVQNKDSTDVPPPATH